MGDAVMEGLRWLTLAAAVAIFVVVEAWLLRAAWQPHADAPRPPEATSAVRLQRGWELLWAMLPALGLLILVFAAARAGFPSLFGGS